jgi:hypothetical protein
MNGTISKEYESCLVVSIEDLKLLDNFVKSEYTHVEYTLFVSNGIEYNNVTFDDIIGYSNYDASKITHIHITAKKKQSTYRHDFELSLHDSTKYDSSATYKITDATEQEINHLTQKLKELINGFKPKYSWLFNLKSKLFFLALLIISTLVIPLNLLYLNDKIDMGLLWMAQISLGVIFGQLFLGFYDEIASFFFPKTIFRIGKQEEFYKKKKRLRQNLFWGILMTFIISLFASLLVFIITE